MWLFPPFFILHHMMARHEIQKNILNLHTHKSVHFGFWGTHKILNIHTHKIYTLQPKSIHFNQFSEGGSIGQYHSETWNFENILKHAYTHVCGFSQGGGISILSTINCTKSFRVTRVTATFGPLAQRGPRGPKTVTSIWSSPSFISYIIICTNMEKVRSFYGYICGDKLLSITWLRDISTP